jgi:hypothetical protein
MRRFGAASARFGALGTGLVRNCRANLLPCAKPKDGHHLDIKALFSLINGDA